MNNKLKSIAVYDIAFKVFLVYFKLLYLLNPLLFKGLMDQFMRHAMSNDTMKEKNMFDGVIW